MKKVLLVLVAIVLLWGGSLAWAGTWQNISRENTFIQAVLSNVEMIYLGSDKGVFKSQDQGQSWRNLLCLRGDSRQVNFLAADSQNKNHLYAATASGLYFTADAGRNWKRIFQGKSSQERNCTALAVFPQALYLGTGAGLFTSPDRGCSWHKETGYIGNTAILNIAYSPKEPDYLYVAAVKGLFRAKVPAQEWQKVFSASPTEKIPDDDGSGEDDADAEDSSSEIKYVAVDANNAGVVYLATENGVERSPDRGENWQGLSDYGLISREVNFIMLSAESRIFCLTKWGIFEYADKRWQDLNSGLESRKINFLSSDKENLYAACDKGLFRAKIKDLRAWGNADLFSAYRGNEPAINQVQQAAIQYAEVEPQKIARWRKQAARKAILPKVSIGMDQDLDRTTSSNIWGTYSSNGTPGRYYAGPDDITKYNQKNWSVSLTWELGDLIWSDDQTNIDVRSRLMVELRDDILDEVTKLYFERLRVKMEIDALGIEERKKRAERELKVQELTASIDALTGGYFSAQIKNKES
jgi:hypothetical protein